MFWKKTAPVRTAAKPAISALAMALEPRMMFDGAVAATAAEVADTQAANAQPTADASSSHDNLAATPTGTADNRQEIVFVDGQVQDYQQLLAGLNPGTEVVVLDPKGDGLKQISDYLAGRSGIDAIHIVSHGLPGQVTLGSLALDKAGLDAHAAELAQIGQSLDVDGDILFYGCDVGSGAAGQTFVSQIAQLTGADVAASNDATGSTSQGGDWALEVTSGSIEAVTPFSASAQQAFSGRLFAGTLNFSGPDAVLGTTVTDGQANSTDIPGVVIEIYSANSGNTNSNSQWEYYSNLFGDGTPNAEGIVDASGDGTPIIIIRSQNGADFSFTGIKVVDYLGVHPQITFEAFRDGVSLGSVTLTTDTGDYISDFTQANGLTASIFQNVDEIRISDPSSGDGNLYVGIDNIGFAEVPRPALVSATFSDNNLKIGETSIVTFTFNIAVSGFTTADLTVPNGNISGLSSSDGGLTWTGLFTPNASVTDGTNVITVDLSGVSAVSGGLAGVGTADSSNYVIDTLAPSVTSVTSSTANGTYKAGDVISVQVNFGEVVTVAGTPQLTMETGSTDRTINYASGSGTSTLSFNYTVQAGDSAADLDYISSGALALNGGTIRDAAGNNAILTLAAPGAAGSLGANKDIVINSAPAIANLNGDSVAWAGAGNTVTLDASMNATFSDTEFGALNGGNGNWFGATLTIQQANGAVPSDVFGLSTLGASFTVSGNTLQSGGLTFATFTSSGGVLTIAFTSTGTAATTALVNDVARHVTYRSDTPAGDATISFSMTDGTSTATANTTVTSDTIYVTNATDTATIDRTDGVSFSEAIAIAAADATGSQTIVFASNLAGQTLNLNTVSLNESLTFDMTQASGLTLTGGTITLAGGTTQAFNVGFGYSATISSLVAGSGALTKTGAGELTLSNSNTNTGTTAVSAGTLVVDGSTSSSTTVAGGATLAGSGTLGGDVTVQNGGTLSPGGAGVGTLTVNGNLTLNSGSTLALDINGITAGTGYDRVVVNGTVDVSAANLSVTHGYAAGSGDSYTVIVNDAADAVTGTFSGVSEGGKFNAAGNGTELTTSYTGGTGNDLTLTTPIAPTITNVSSSTANGTYKIGDVITVNVQFDSAVNVTGIPTLTLETGATDRVLNYLSGSGTNTLSFSYTVQAGDSSADLDYASTTALSLNGGSIQDGANQNAILTLATPGAAGSLGANNALVVDGVRPAATSITLSDTNLRIGETATVTITFNEAVLGLDVGDFNVANGSLSNPSSSDGGLTWTATFTPSANITDASNIITLNNTGVMDSAGNIGSGTTDSVNYAIDTQRPTATIVVTDTTLKAGQTTTVTITFNEAVSGLGIGDFTVDNGTLSGLSSNDGGITWTATLTPGANVTDTSNLVSLDNTGYIDQAGNAGTGSTDSNNYAIDTQRPTATSVQVADTALKAGQTTTVTITFSEAVTGLTTTDFSVANGALSNLSSSDGGLTWTATLTPDADVTDATNLITLDNTGYTDAAGNTGTGTTDSNNYAIDSKAPAVTSVSVPANGTYVAGDTLDFTVNFDETVTIDTTGGTPRLAITLDTGGTVYANYLSGSGSNALVFRLTVANGQQDSSGITIGANLQANGATLRDAAGNDTATSLNNVGTTTAVLVDAAPPQVTGIALDSTSPTTSNTLGFTVTFSEDVNGVDLTDFALATTGSANGTLLSLVQVDARTYRVTVSGVTGQGTLGLSLTAAGSGIVDGVGNAMLSNFSSASYTLGSLDNGDPEFRANPTPNISTTPTSPIEPNLPSAPPPSVTTSPLLPPPLFEVPTLGSGIPTLGNIFINNGALAPSYIAQVFASSDSGAGNGSGIGFLGFGGGDGGVFGSSSFSGIFGKDTPQDNEKLEVFDGNKWGTSGGIFGAPTLGQQLHDLHEGEQRQHRELALALQQIAAAQPPI
ncbi:Autotransporter-associated beta strand repeat-containing protein [Ectopseudomonas composti]|uniref:Autotransporter-associated beta strand repeat-containing protein n=2 Tax=Ectopseudomonas composti TaxID=658457 RepID=A0A1I5JHD2_9GAMM|nr:Ig-like domain-containing protein [Pseudomonas composti]SFO72227.1 Autotransporter-associated beta strand repeat-containing protein [Pseudomonas composti]